MKAFTAKVLLFIAMIFIAQSLIVRLFVRTEKDIIPPNILLAEKYLKEKIDIIYFGDSAIFWKASSMQGVTIPDLLQEKIARYKVGMIAHEAYTPDIYLEFCRFIAKKPQHPKIVIIPINMRVFSVGWDRKPGYQFEKEKIFLKSGNSIILPLFYHFLSVFKVFSPQVTEYAYQNTLVFDGDAMVGRASEFDNIGYRTWSESNMKNKLVFNYLYHLTQKHRKVKAIIKTADILNKHGIACIFYIIPLDYQTAERYVGRRFKDRISQNTALLKAHLKQRGVELLDFSFSLDEKFFSWQQFLYPNEHLTPEGKDFVAEQIAKKIERMFP